MVAYRNAVWKAPVFMRLLSPHGNLEPTNVLGFDRHGGLRSPDAAGRAQDGAGQRDRG